MTVRRPQWIAAAVLAVVVLWFLAWPTGGADRSERPTDRTEAAVTTGFPSGPAAPISPALDALVVAGPDPDLAPYRRDAFGGDWDYDPATGCNTRELVLIAEAVVAPQVDDRCRSTQGRWRSRYDGVVVDDVADLQIDHLVPLADAWRSGASAWTDDRRDAFANDLDHPEELMAVTGRTNQSKSDSTPDQWLPPEQTEWCSYATDWVTVKAAWSLTVTPPEKAAIVGILADC